MFNTKLFKSKIDKIMQEAAPDSYRFFICDRESVLGFGSGGFSRMAIDQPELKATIKDRLNVASMSKTVTAAAVLNTLQRKNLSIDTPVAKFLPPSWSLHEKVKTLTFKNFLNHRTGFNEATDRSDFEGIKNSLQQGPPNPPNTAQDYRNINFAVFRIILPYLDSYNRFTKTVTFAPLTVNGVVPNLPLTLADKYIQIVNERVLKPSGVETAGCHSKTIAPAQSPNGLPAPPSKHLAALLYQYKNPNKAGIDLGDSKLSCGASGWSLSVVDYALFLQTLFFTEVIISDTTRKKMLEDEPGASKGLGINMDQKVANGNVFSHGGWIPFTGTTAQLASWHIYFERNDIIVVALSNAGHKPNHPNWFDSVKEAYAQSWELSVGIGKN